MGAAATVAPASTAAAKAAGTASTGTEATAGSRGLSPQYCLTSAEMLLPRQFALPVGKA